MDLVGRRLTFPFEPGINPNADEAGELLEQWARAQGMLCDAPQLKKLRQGRFNRLAARLYPQADRDGCRLLSLWMGWAFLCDDVLDETPAARDIAILTPFIDALAGILNRDTLRSATGKGLADLPGGAAMRAAFADLWERTQAATSPAWQAEFAPNLIRWLYSYQVQAEMNALEQVLDEGAYAIHRLRSGAGEAMTNLVELATRRPLSARLRHNPAVAELQELAATIMAWTNDLFSAAKERSRGERFNFVTVLQRSQGLSPKAAASVLVRRIEGRIQRFATVEQRTMLFRRELTGEERDALDAYILGCKYFAVGFHDWSAEAERYRDAPTSSTSPTP